MTPAFEISTDALEHIASVSRDYRWVMLAIDADAPQVIALSYDDCDNFKAEGSHVLTAWDLSAEQNVKPTPAALAALADSCAQNGIEWENPS